MIAPTISRVPLSCVRTESEVTEIDTCILLDNVREWDSFSNTHNDHSLEDSILLERRGITSQKPDVSRIRTPKLRQKELWRTGTIHKLTVSSKLRVQGLIDFADKLDRCHTEWTIAHCGNCHAVRKFANRCDLFCCPECAHSLQIHRAKQVEWWTKIVKQPKHVVLTIHNLPDLTTGHLAHLKKMFSRLRRRKFANNWRGGFYRIEITNEGRGWHLHLHALIDAKWIDKTELSQQWKSITNGLGYIVDVKDCRGESYLREVTKYVVKGSELAKWNAPDVAEFVTAFDGQRTFGVFGSLFGMRTEFADYVDSLREAKSACPCGANCMNYYTEAEWLLRLTPVIVQHRSQPPPPLLHQISLLAQRPRWPD